jgi:hypothetical protein
VEELPFKSPWEWTKQTWKWLAKVKVLGMVEIIAEFPFEK